jgi:tRNA threonylcarbamoyladenosine biosynthesis protein TsaE
MNENKENFYEKSFILSEKNLSDFCIKFAGYIKKNYIFFLSGDLGAGKTFFIKKICEYFQHQEVLSDDLFNISSPSFSIYHKYEFQKFNIWHYDLYRLNKEEITNYELINIDFFDAIEDGVVFVEWANKLNFFNENNFKDNIIYINIDFLNNKDSEENDLSRLYKFNVPFKMHELINFLSFFLN